MANGKKSFIIYTDSKSLVNKLPDEVAGKLFKMLFSYTCDEKPKTKNPLLDLAFEHFKQKLKVDLKKWEQIKEKRSMAGKASAKLRKQNQQVLTSVKSVEQTSTNPTVNVNVSVNGIYKEKDFLKNWNEMRTHHLQTPSNLNKLSLEEGDLFSVAEFSKQDWHLGLQGLFKQENMPQEIMRFKPKHFLKNTDQYIDAEKNKKYNLYAN